MGAFRRIRTLNRNNPAAPRQIDSVISLPLPDAPNIMHIAAHDQDD